MKTVAYSVPKGKTDSAEKLESTRQILGKPTPNARSPTVCMTDSEPKREAICLSPALIDVLSCITWWATSHSCSLQPSEQWARGWDPSKKLEFILNS